VLRWTGWTLHYDKWNDYSNKSIYGDYDVLWGLHGNTNIGNKVDVGVTYLNHHRSDIKKGEGIFTGDVPNDYIPSEVHFEFYDLTPNISSDPGARVVNVSMTMNGKPVSNDNVRSVYTVAENLSLKKSRIPISVSGNNRPIIVAFNTSFAAKRDYGDTTKVKSIDFSFTVAGNYLVFVSTDKMVSLGASAHRNPATQIVDFAGPFTRTIEDLSRGFQPIEEITGDNNPTTSPLFDTDFTKYGNSYFGDYIARSPRIIFSDAAGVSQVYATSERTYTYSYSINSASITYGLDVKGKLFGVNLDGEIAVNQKNYLFPGGDQLDAVYRTAAYLRFDRDIIKDKFVASGMVYNVDAQYDPAMDIPQVSQHFSYSRLYTKLKTSEEYSIPDYLFYPQHLNNNFHLLDDNDDQDLYVESDRIVYPSDLGSGNVTNLWHSDGTLNSYKAASRGDRRLHRKANYTYLPNGLYRFYGDDDGVYVDRFDRNRNGRVDYKEDFLLYNVDPPIFDLDVDVDNNGIWDVEDDDPFPDLPDGIKVSYVLNANGWKSQGIRGTNFQLKFHPVKTLELTTKVIYEKAVDLDFNRNSDNSLDNPSLFGNGEIEYNGGTVSEEFRDSRSLVLKGAALLDVVKRSQGIAYLLGAEAQYLQDNIRNDVIRLQEVEDPEFIFEDFYYQTDELRFRKAMVGNLISQVTYNNIPNFLYTAKLSLGADKRLGLGNDLFYTVRTLRNQVEDTTLYVFGYEKFESSLLKRLFLVKKFDYTVNFDFEFKKRLRFLNFLNRLSLNPQFKFTWDYSTSDAMTDPRETADLSTLRSETDSTALRLDWARYRLENSNEFMSVPIFRLGYKIAERTQLQFGVQWKKTYDQLVRSESSSRRVQTFQVSSSDNVAGYNVSLVMGMNLIKDDYDILDFDPVFQTGRRYDGKDTQFFIKVYAGN